MESFFSLALPIRSGVANIMMTIPPEQRGPQDTDTFVWLPAGMHTIIIQWEGAHPLIRAKLWDGTPNGYTFATLDGGRGSGQKIATLVVPPGGKQISFLQGFAVSEEEANAFPNTLGVTVILGETREA